MRRSPATVAPSSYGRSSPTLIIILRWPCWRKAISQQAGRNTSGAGRPRNLGRPTAASLNRSGAVSRQREKRC